MRKQKSEVLVTQLCLTLSDPIDYNPTLCDPMDYSPLGSSVHGILKARILEWVAISFSRGIFPTQGSNPGLLHAGIFFTILATTEAQENRGRIHIQNNLKLCSFSLSYNSLSPSSATFLITLLSPLFPHLPSLASLCSILSKPKSNCQPNHDHPLFLK